MKLYEVDSRYISYLMKFEPRKILSNTDEKASRKFMGIIMMNGGFKYFVPLSSPKYRKDFKIKGCNENDLPTDFSFEKYADRLIMIKTTCTPVVYMFNDYKDGRIDLFGKLQCNNMIPVPDSEIVEVDIATIKDHKYRNLLQKQIDFLRIHSDKIYKKHINPVYINRVKNNFKLGYIKNATPDFAILEVKSKEWEELIQLSKVN